ncbi:MAG: hypothetical protein ABR591_13320 [Candidatus Velthaea sp.]
MLLRIQRHRDDAVGARINLSLGGTGNVAAQLPTYYVWSGTGCATIR